MSHSYGTYLEELRKSRNIPPQEFVDGIMSYRQYRRYINNECSIPNDKFIQLIEKCQIDIYEFTKGYEKQSEILNSKLKLVYDSIRIKDFKKATVLHESIDKNLLSSKYLENYYVFNEVTLQYNKSNISELTALNRLKTLIDYPNCLNKENLGFIELISLLHIIYLSKDSDDLIKVGDYLYKYLIRDDFYILGTDSNVLTSIYSGVTRILLRTKRIEEALVISKKGIRYCMEIESFNSLANLLYYAAYSSLKIKDFSEAEIFIKQLDSLLNLMNNDRLTQSYREYLNILIKLKEGL